MKVSRTIEDSIENVVRSIDLDLVGGAAKHAVMKGRVALPVEGTFVTLSVFNVSRHYGYTIVESKDFLTRLVSGLQPIDAFSQISVCTVLLEVVPRVVSKEPRTCLDEN